MKKILFIPPMPWYMETHYEYLIRYLSDEFFLEQAFVPYPPYENFLDKPENSPFMRSPDDYDLCIPILATHWGITEFEKYKHKVALVLYQPGEGKWRDVEVLGLATPEVESQNYEDKKTHSLRFGIDTELFKPYEMLREDDLLHVGIIGTLTNPRRQIVEAILPLLNMEGVRFMFFPHIWINQGDVDKLGGDEYLKRVVTGGKRWPGIPNIYNRLDVLLRLDNCPGYSFPTLEAAACGVPVIVTNQGIDHHITEAGGGILIKPDTQEATTYWPFNKEQELVDKLREAIEYMRDNPEERIQMGKDGRKEIEANWTWEQHIPSWREFLREALSYA